MPPANIINKKKQSAGNRRSKKNSSPQNIKLKNCLILVKKLKFKNTNMRKVNIVEQKKLNTNKKTSPIERRPEIRIIKAVSNVAKPMNRDNINVKMKNNPITKQKSRESSDDEISKSTQWQNVKYSQKIVRKSPSGGKNDKKKLEKKIPDNKPTLKKSIENKIVEDTPTRSKRTIKPNRKYLNDNLITSFKKNDKILRKIDVGLTDSESEIDNSNGSSSDVDSDILQESDESSAGEEEYEPKGKLKSNVTSGNKKSPPNISQTMKKKIIIDAMEKSKINQFNKLNQGYKSVSVQKQTNDIASGKTIILNKYSYNQSSNNKILQKGEPPKTLIDRSQKNKQLLQTNLNLIRKRKLNEQMQQRQVIKRPKINEKSNLKSDFDSYIEIDDDDDADNTDIDDLLKELTTQKQIKVVKNISQQVNKKPLNQEIRTITSNLTRSPTILNKTTQQSEERDATIENKNNNQQSTKKNINENYEIDNESADSILESDKETSEKDDPFQKNEKSGLEDFEKMPTFTIVNINDIMGKKGNFMLEKHDPLKSEDAFASQDSSDENDSFIKKKNNSSTASLAAHRNRRKAMHTNLLSENIDKNKDPPPRTPFPPPRKNTVNNKSIKQLLKNKLASINESNMKILNNNIKLSKSTSSNKRDSLLSNKSIKGPPRILNSMVAKKTTPITTFNTKVDTRRSDDLSDSDNEKMIHGKFSKENILKNQLFKQSNENKQENKNQTTIGGIKRKLPSEKVVIQRQGNKIIKKITCFETWYVINLPPETIEKENTIRNIVNVSLIRLANQAKTVNLPNSKWTCKVSLQKCQSTMILKDCEPYTGEIYDDYINPDELHKYRPTNVMFRRQALHPTPKVPYDRAVIFKNNTFFTNIEGKNVKLIGAPHQIEQLNDIEILLNLVDEFSLKNQFIEQAPYVP